jgi:hypothetical protein
MSLRTRSAAIAAAAAVITLFGSSATQAIAATAPANTTPSAAQTSAVDPGDAVTVPVTGLVNGKPVTGMLSIAKSLVNGVPTLTGTLTGTGLPACAIFTLNVPTDLDLRELATHLDPVHLDANGLTVQGQLLGNLCGGGGLLEPGAPGLPPAPGDPALPLLAALAQPLTPLLSALLPALTPILPPRT